jgi:hypothetical protein
VHERHVELALHLLLKRPDGIAVALDDLDDDVRGAAGVFEAPAPRVEHQSGDAQRRKMRGDRVGELGDVERARQFGDMHGVVRIQFPPPQHRRLE